MSNNDIIGVITVVVRPNDIGLSYALPNGGYLTEQIEDGDFERLGELINKAKQQYALKKEKVTK